MLIIQSTSALVVMLSSLWLLARIAPILGLVDAPSFRKLHATPVPLVGGISIYITILFCVLVWPSQLVGVAWTSDGSATTVLMLCMGALVGFGVIDDRFDLGVGSRIILEVLIAATLTALLDLRVINLGNLFGFGTIQLTPVIGYAFTIIAIFGVINAVNMLDGLDGLVAVTILSSLVFFQSAFVTAINPAIVLTCVCLSVFVASNLELVRGLPKTFLGDAGSRLLGLIVACLLLAAASSRVGGEKLIAPTTALYMIAVPLFDMVFTVTRRVLRGLSPFAADRTHIHHLLLALGHQDKWVLIFIVSLNLSFNALGLYLHKVTAPEHQQLMLFCLSFIVYASAATHFWSKTNN